MLKLDGAFAPVSKRRCIGFWRAGISPPERFVAAQLSGGLNTLYRKILYKRKDPHKQYGSQTDADGKFQACYPVPLLAGRYKFVQVIGQGQSSVLVAAEDTFHPDKKPVAVKIMHLDYSRLGAQEADCIQQLNKADILCVSRTVQLFNTFSFEGHYCLAFELLRPRPLHQYFQKCQFDNEEAKLKLIRKITLQLLQALGFLKRENVIHADLKPENILFEEGEEIKIKVVDFGNAMHWVHSEVSLYYDEFELQTLLYRAPEVMFGIPFGPEIDVWSLGCILAELYIGKPLFLGRNKNEIMQEVTSVFGPVPRNPFQTGKFFQDLSEFVTLNPEVSQLVHVSNLMRKLHNSRNYTFASFLVGLLQYNPGKRLTPSQAAMYQFLAPDFPCAYLLPQQGDTISDAAAAYSDILIPPEQYISKPHVDEEIKRQHFSGTELLKRGTTTVLYKSNKILSPSLLTKQEKENIAKDCLLAESVNSANATYSNEVVVMDDKSTKSDLLLIENCRYAMEGPLTTGKPKPARPHKKSPLHKEKISIGDKEIKVKEISVKPAIPTHKNPVCGNQNNNIFLKLDSKDPSAIKVKSCETDTSQCHSNVTPGINVICNIKDHFSSENILERPSWWNNEVATTSGAENNDRFHRTSIYTKTRLDLDQCSSFDETNSAARTRAYNRNTKFRNLEQQNDLSPELKCSKLEDPIAGQREEKKVKTSLVDQNLTTRRRRKKLSQEPLEQDSEKAGSPGKYQHDVVMLL